MRDFQATHIPKPRIQFQMPELVALDFEIGAGQGLHAVRYAMMNPERHLIAAEKTHERFDRLVRRLRQHPKIKNVTALHIDAVAFACHYLPDASIDRVFLLYPNPYPKTKQANLRWHNRPFVQMLLRKMKSNAELTLATNLEWYADEAELSFIKTWGLTLLDKRQVEQNHPPRTHFEKKYLARDEVCWNLVFTKSQSCHLSRGRVE